MLIFGKRKLQKLCTQTYVRPWGKRSCDANISHCQSSFHNKFKPGNPIPLGVGRKGSFFYKKNKKFLIFLLSPEKSSILNITEQKPTKSAERGKANGSKRAECNDIHKGKVVS